MAATPQKLAVLHRSTNRPVGAEVLEARAAKIRAINRCPPATLPAETLPGRCVGTVCSVRSYHHSTTFAAPDTSVRAARSWVRPAQKKGAGLRGIDIAC